MSSNSIEVRPIAGALGAEIHGLDLSRPLSDDSFAVVHQAFLDHLAIFFPGQSLTMDQYQAFARHFGELTFYPFGKGIEGYPLIMDVIKETHETVNFGGLWHSDTTYLKQPPLATMLYALETPPYGGDTMFANMYLAYETLSDGMKAMLAPLKGVNAAGGGQAAHTRRSQAMAIANLDAEENYVAEHPIVRTHPETGRKSLYCNLGHTRHFAGMTPEESLPLLAYLCAHAVRPEFTCRFPWAVGSVAIWDNRSAQHYPINDYHGHRRHMRRITLGAQTPA
ncbi:MAG: TauD/TfdA family dioxygenase [Alphaproteobacteria bacterium]|nr:TauD/TfdA family dioxygenase [Alphaproteobacteria bacterium]